MLEIFFFLFTISFSCEHERYWYMCAIHYWVTVAIQNWLTLSLNIFVTYSLNAFECFCDRCSFSIITTLRQDWFNGQGFSHITQLEFFFSHIFCFKFLSGMILVTACNYFGRGFGMSWHCNFLILQPLHQQTFQSSYSLIEFWKKFFCMTRYKVLWILYFDTSAGFVMVSLVSGDLEVSFSVFIWW